jgi:hypothetical protein
MVCKNCIALEGINNITISSLDYPKVTVANGELFPVTIALTNSVAPGPFDLCIYVNGIINSTETITFPGWNQTITKTYQIKMGSSDAYINVSVIDVGVLYSNCDNFQDFVVYYKAAVAPRQSCMAGVCTPTLNGTYANLKECTDTGCKAPATTTSGCPNCDLNKNYCLPVLGCQSKNNVYIGIGALFLFMMIQKK